jgi:hypothetical protein
MTTPTPSELRALDLHMAEKVMGWKRFSGALCDILQMIDGEFVDNGISIRHGRQMNAFHPTESPADAMMVLKKVSEGKARNLIIYHHGKDWIISEEDKHAHYEGAEKNHVDAPSLELAICLFAREVTCG